MTIETHEVHTVYWGTNIDEKDIERKFERFIHEYRNEG